MIRGFPRVDGLGPASAPTQTIDSLPGFGDALEALLRQPAAPPTAAGVGGEVSFSKHAQARLASRGIELDSADLEDLGKAVEQLAQRGARESLVLLGDNAFVVGIAERKVITALTRQEAIGNIFTNIDSTVVVR